MADRTLQVTFRNLDSSQYLSRRAQAKFQKLRNLHDRISSCHVVIEAPNRLNKGMHYSVRIELRIPGRSIVVQHGSAGDPRSEKASSAMIDAFDRVRRILVSHLERTHRRHHMPMRSTAAA